MNRNLRLQVTRLRFAVLGRLVPRWSATVAMRRFVSPHRRPRPATEADLLRSGTSLTFASDLAAVAWGEGPTILLVHGWEGRGTNLAAFIPPLVASGLRVVALDGPAHGDSPGEETNPLEFAQALLIVGQEIGLLQGVVAHSFGATATVIAIHRGLGVQRVVLIAGFASLRGVVDRFAVHIGLPARAVPLLRGLIVKRFGLAAAEELDLTHLVLQFQIPALVFHDPDDREVPFDDGLAIASAWPNAQLCPIHGTGHRRILQAQEVVNQTVAFFAGPNQNRDDHREE